MRLSCRGGCRLLPHRPVVSRLNLHFQVRFHLMCNRPGRSIGGSAACVVLTDNRSLRSRLVRAVPCVGLTEHRSLRSRLHPRHRLRPPAVHPFMLRRVLRPSLLRRALLRRERRPSSSPVVVLWGKAHIAHGWGRGTRVYALRLSPAGSILIPLGRCVREGSFTAVTRTVIFIQRAYAVGMVKESALHCTERMPHPIFSAATLSAVYGTPSLPRTSVGEPSLAAACSAI